HPSDIPGEDPADAPRLWRPALPVRPTGSPRRGSCICRAGADRITFNIGALLEHADLGVIIPGRWEVSHVADARQPAAVLRWRDPARGPDSGGPLAPRWCL